MKSITVFTPTYNRAYCLDQVYESLVRQSSNDFVWLVIDDGSTDTTPELVQTWIATNTIEIHYLYQENQGMHGAHNTAYKNITTPLNVCIDSDDYMPDDAIELILSHQSELQNDNLAGLLGLDVYKNGNIIGTSIPNHIKESTVNELYYKHGVQGDKKVVVKTAVVKQFPLYPVYKGEKLVPLGTLYLLIDQKYKWLCTNDVLCVVEYLADGSSHSILKQYKVSPRGFGYFRLIKMKYSKSILEKIKSAIHLVSSAIFAQDFRLITKASNPFLVVLALPVGVILNIYIRIKTNKKYEGFTSHK
jgi:glycosyltransferase involved in cell wall biosynthesis